MAEEKSKKEFYVKVATIAALVVSISILHYETHTSKPLLHDIYRRLYYIPVGLGAVWFGVKGGFLTSFIVSAMYVPHIILHWNDMGREMANRGLEVLLFFFFSGITGYFADRERKFRLRWQASAQELEKSYSDLRKQADMILEIEEQLRQADKMSAVGCLAAEMTHEIRNPLGAIKGTAEILRDDFPANHPKSEFFDILFKEINRLNEVVENFLGLAKHPTLDRFEEIDMNDLLRETVKLMAPEAARTKVSLKQYSRPGLLVRGYPSQLKQVLVNLSLNAIQASPEGGEIMIKTKETEGKVYAAEYREVEGRLVRISITNQGSEIPERTLQKVFDPFFSTKDRGTGLGLAISQRIAQAHEGTLQAENTAEGAKFTLTLPLLQRSKNKRESDA